MRYIEKYKNDIYPFPDRDVSAEEKNKPEYVVRIAEAIYSRHLKNKTGVSYSFNSVIDTLRAYGKGAQDENIYKRYLFGSAPNTQDEGIVTDTDGSWNANRKYERKGWMNVLWDIVSPAGRIRNMIHGMFDDIDFDVVADAIDADSGEEEEQNKWRTWVMTRANIARKFQEFHQRANIPYDAPEFIPENLQELEMYQEAGGFKVAYASELQKLLRHTDHVSNWSNLKSKLLDDMIDLAMAFIKAEYDDDRKKIVWRYVDPKDLVIQYSKHDDFNDSSFGGEFREMKIADVRTQLLEEGYKEDDIKAIAKNYCGIHDNPSKNDWDKYNQYTNGVWAYDDFKITVFQFEWIDKEKTKKVRYENTYGKIRWLEYKDGQKLGKREKLVQSSKDFLHEGRWIVGTEYAFKYGKVYYQPRPKPNKVELTYKGVKLSTKPLTMQLIPIYDNIQISWLKYQNSLAIMFEEGYAFDFSMLQNIEDGQQKYSAMDAIKMFKERGILPFRSLPVGQLYYRGGGTQPIHKVPGGMGDVLNQAISRLRFQMEMIQHITGLSPVALGAQPEPDTPVATTERSLQATHNSMKPMIEGLFNIKDYAAKVTSSRIQQLIKWDEKSRKQYEKVIGRTGVMAIRRATNSHVEYGIRLQARPTNQEKMQLMKHVEIALQPGRDGIRLITFADGLYIMERLQGGGDLKELRMYLASAERKQQQRIAAEKQQMIRQQGEQNRMNEQQKIKFEEYKQQLESQLSLKEIDAKTKGEKEVKLMEINGDYIEELVRAAKEEMIAKEREENATGE